MEMEPLKTLGHGSYLGRGSSPETTSGAPIAPEKHQGLDPILVLGTVSVLMLYLAFWGLCIPFLGLPT